MKTFWRILKLLGDYKWLTIVGFALAFAQMGLGLVVPRIIQLTINNALLGTARPACWSPTVSPSSASPSSASSSASAGASPPARSASTSSTTCATGCGRTCSASPFGYFDRWPTGQLMSRAMSDIQNVRMFLGYGLVFFATNIVMMVAISVILLLPGLEAGAACPWRSCRSCCW